MLSVSTMLAVWVQSVYYAGEGGAAPPQYLYRLVNSPIAYVLCLRSTRKLLKQRVSILYSNIYYYTITYVCR